MTSPAEAAGAARQVDEDAPPEDVLRIRRPSDGSLVGETPVRGAQDVREAVHRARKAQAGWADFDPGERARRLGGLRRVLGERAEEVAALVMAETGKPEAEALAEVLVVIDLVAYYARVAPDVLGRRKVGTGWLVTRRAYTLREPWGVVGVISPWNYPFILTMDPVVTALFAGNAVVLKPSELTPFTALLIPELMESAGIPAGLVSVVPGDGGTGRALVEADVDKILFTGSVPTGRRVMETAARGPTPVALELGGKDAALVLADADLVRTARGVVFGAFFNAGQTCISVERAFVVDPIHDAFVQRLVDEASRLRVGSSGEVDVGPMTTPAQLRIVEEHVDDAVERGATVVLGGARTDPASNVFQPTILTGVDPDARIMTEETFGPVLPLVRVADEEEGVRLANRAPFGLFASVWTADRARGEALARRLRAGGVSVNDVLTHYAVPGLPMGGVGESGFGRTRGVEGLLEMSRTRTVAVDRLGLRREPWWFPYGPGSSRLVRALIAYRAAGGLSGALAGLGVFFRGRDG